MEQVASSTIDVDSDIDLESGGTTSEEDVRKGRALSDDHRKSQIKGSKFVSSESSHGSGNAGDCSSSPYGNLSSSDEIDHYKNKEMNLARLREDQMENMSLNKKRVKKQSAGRPPRPHRPPKGPSLDPYDMRLVKEIYELNLKRRRMGRIRAFNKMKRHKGPTMKSNLLACCVTIIFFLIVILQGLLGSRV